MRRSANQVVHRHLNASGTSAEKSHGKSLEHVALLLVTIDGHIHKAMRMPLARADFGSFGLEREKDDDAPASASKRAHNVRHDRGVRVQTLYLTIHCNCDKTQARSTGRGIRFLPFESSVAFKVGRACIRVKEWHIGCTYGQALLRIHSVQFLAKIFAAP